jgi:hypothetical protein
MSSLNVMDKAESQTLMVPEPASVPVAMVNFDEAAVDVDKEEYRKSSSIQTVLKNHN